MYLKNLNLLIIDIPKNASKTLRKAAKLAGNDVELEGHLTYKQSMYHIRYINPVIVAVIRHPKERLVSAFNFIYNEKYDPCKFVDEVFNLLGNNAISTLGRAAKHAFNPQYHYLDGANKVILYPFSDIDKLCRGIGFLGDIPRENPSPKIITSEMIFEHRGAPKVLENYSHDFYLYNFANALKHSQSPTRASRVYPAYPAP